MCVEVEGVKTKHSFVSQPSACEELYLISVVKPQSKTAYHHFTAALHEAFLTLKKWISMTLGSHVEVSVRYCLQFLPFLFYSHIKKNRKKGIYAYDVLRIIECNS